MAIIDAIWLGMMLKPFYTLHLHHLLSNSISIPPAVIFYLLYAFALNIFVVFPALKEGTGYFNLLFLGCLFGMVTYGTYDLTNQATLKNWPWILTFVDMAWGGCLTGTVSIIATFTTRYFFL